jgi:O-antigen/teichoic acid export membrane protein
MTDPKNNDVGDPPAASISMVENSSTLPKPAKTLKSQLLGGSLMLLAGSGLVGITNLAYNLVTARLLGPSGFADATAVYTILMLVSCVTLSFQVVCAKYIARSSTPEKRTAVFAELHSRSWIAGIALGLLLFLFRGSVTRYLALPDPILVSLLALGAMFYIPLGVRRGYIQGVHAFGPLAINFMLEGLVRLGALCLLVRLGWGVQGAVFASVLAVAVSYFFANPSPSIRLLDFGKSSIPSREGLQAIVFFAGQTIINNFDIVLVKHFFPPTEAGFYAAIALVGRLVNMCAWSVVNTMFPVSAGARADEQEGGSVLSTSLLLVSVILSALVFVLWMIPSFLWKSLFGSQFETSAYGNLAPLLILYAITAGIYSLSSVIVTYEMSRKIANTSWLQLVFSGFLVFGIYFLHQNLRQVILVQLVLMIVLLLVLIVPLLRSRREEKILKSYDSLHLRRALRVEEVMAEFLKSEFHHAEFDQYRNQFDDLVKHPDLNSERENDLRQALLFLRRGSMWRELPADTKWFELELTPNDLERIRFFPRAQWRRAARGSFYLTNVVDRIRPKLQAPNSSKFIDKLRLLTLSVQESLVSPTVILIGVDDKTRLTILDGNHRLAAAMLGQPDSVCSRFRFICGLSSEMMKCCWYDTTVNTLLRYLKNLVLYMRYDAESDIGRFQERGY